MLKVFHAMIIQLLLEALALYLADFRSMRIFTTSLGNY